MLFCVYLHLYLSVFSTTQELYLLSVPSGRHHPLTLISLPMSNPHEAIGPTLFAALQYRFSYALPSLTQPLAQERLPKIRLPSLHGISNLQEYETGPPTAICVKNRDFGDEYLAYVQ